MIYDCFTFFNELELLELRLQELAGVVDKFVLVESDRTFTNKPKPLHFQENRQRFAAFESKIIHIVVADSPNISDAWVVERFQRNAIGRGLRGCRPDDWVLVSDLDEIPRATAVAKLSQESSFNKGDVSSAIHAALNSDLVKWIFYRRGLRRRLRLNHPFVWKFRQEAHRYFLNGRSVPTRFTHGTRMLRYRDFSCAEEIRHSGYKIIKNGGWHFSWMGGIERIQTKIGAYAHQEFNQPQYNNPQHLAHAVNEGRWLFNENERMEFVRLDETFPRYVVENPEKYSNWLRPVGG